MRYALALCVGLAACGTENTLEAGGDDDVVAPRPDITLSPDRLDFGAIAQGAVSIQRFSIGNAGDAALSVSALAPGGGSAFVVTAPIPVTIQPGQSVDVEVAYEAVNPADSGWVIVYSDDPDDPEAQVELLGEGLFPELEISPEIYDFGQVGTECEVSAPITLRSVGGAPLTIDQILVVGEDFSWREEGLALPTTLAPGEEVDVRVGWAPATVGEADAQLYVLSDEPVGERTADLGGVGGAEVVAEEWVQPSDGPYEATDILFYVDQSGSMRDDTENLEANFGLFTDLLEEWTNQWQIIVVTDDDGCYNGFIFDPDTQDAPFHFGRAIRGYSGDYTEAGLTLAATALAASGPGGCNEGWLREGVKTNIILVSDEPEQSSGLWSDYVDEILRIAPTATISSIVGDYPDGCETAAPGFGYYEATQSTGGAYLSICATDWGSYFHYLATISSGQPASSFYLAATPEPASIEVAVNDAVETRWVYDDIENAITFDAAAVPGPGARVRAEYTPLVDCEG